MKCPQCNEDTLNAYRNAVVVYRIEENDSKLKMEHDDEATRHYANNNTNIAWVECKKCRTSSLKNDPEILNIYLRLFGVEATLESKIQNLKDEFILGAYYLASNPDKNFKTKQIVDYVSLSSKMYDFVAKQGTGGITSCLIQKKLIVKKHLYYSWNKSYDPVKSREFLKNYIQNNCIITIPTKIDEI